jgi:O-antigen/teichoic acid export membrane protein
VLASVVGLSAAAILIIGGLEWVLAAFGSEFVNGATVFRIVILSGMIEGMSICLYSLFQARGQLWLPLFAFSLPRDVIMVTFAFVLRPNYGAVGLGAATLISSSYTILAVLTTLAFRERNRFFRQSIE